MVYKNWFHSLVVLNFISGMAYCAYILFFVLRPESGDVAALGSQAMSASLDLVIKRRLYALEFWLIFSGFVIYLAVRGKANVSR